MVQTHDLKVMFSPVVISFQNLCSLKQINCQEKLNLVKFGNFEILIFIQFTFLTKTQKILYKIGLFGKKKTMIPLSRNKLH